MQILSIRSGSAIGGAEIYNLNLIRGFRRYYPEDELIFITPNFEFKKRIEIAGAKGVFLPTFSEEIGTKRGLIRFLFNAISFFLFLS